MINRLANIFRPNRRRGGTRGGICLITPVALLWSDRPLFVWDAKVGKIEVWLVDQPRLLWSQVLPANSQSALYQGEPLQPGQTYEVILYDAAGNPQNQQFYPRFTLVEGSKRQQIQADLAQQAARLKAKRSTAEAIGLEQAIYFSEQELWSDAFQTIYAVPNPSAELHQFIQQTTQAACQESSSS